MSGFLGGRKLTFLIIDDEASIREVIKLVLEGEGQVVIESSSGDEAIKYLRVKGNKKPDIILLDIRMPGMKPVDIINEVKRLSPKTLIIYLTSVKAFEPTSEDLRNGWVPEISSPVIGYINKPVTNELLLSKIEEYVRNHELITNHY